MKDPIIWSYWNHEPIYHLKRMGNDGGTVFSLGEWVDEWYDRIHSEELIKKGASLGINTIYTHYYKGSGILFEKEEMERTRELTEIAHKHGIKVLGYMSMGSIYTENITREIPDVADMLCVDRNGKKWPTLGNQYYRPRPCYNSDKYLTHLKSVIKYGVEHVGLDGFHFDNSTNRFCYCDNCQRKFREFLQENFKNPYEVMGIKYFDYVEIPQYEYTNNPWDIHSICPTGNIHDVLFAWYYKFLRKTLNDFHRACFDYVKEVSGGKALVLHNPGFPRDGRDTRTKGYDPTGSPESCDFAFVENVGGYFGKNNGRTDGQIEAFKFGERFGYKVFDTSWASENGKKYQFPKNKAVIEGFVMQSAVYGGLVGAPWTVRSMKQGDRVAIDTPYLYQGLKECFDYFKENASIFNATSYNHVKLLHNPDNYVYAEGAVAEFDFVTTALTLNNINYSIITEDEIGNLAAGDTVILPKIIYCRDSLYKDLKAASERGVGIVATGGFGHYNENTKGRSMDNEILDLQGIASAAVISKEELADRIDRTLSVDASDVLLEARMTEDGCLVLHILNADAERDLDETVVRFKDDLLKEMCGARIKTPDESSATCEISHDTAVITVKNLKTIVSIIFERKES